MSLNSDLLNLGERTVVSVVVVVVVEFARTKGSNVELNECLANGSSHAESDIEA